MGAVKQMQIEFDEMKEELRRVRENYDKADLDRKMAWEKISQWSQKYDGLLRERDELRELLKEAAIYVGAEAEKSPGFEYLWDLRSKIQKAVGE
jgi:hypothetical protein